nr:hypothetical protein [Tanacetum cinerariifolium]
SSRKSLGDNSSQRIVLTEAVSLNPIDLELLKVDVAPLVPKLRKNRTAHTDYIRHTQEEAATLREIVESERLLSPLNTSLDYDLTPKNKTKQIRLTKQITKSGKTTVTTPPSANIDSNTPVLSSTGVTLVSSASGSISQDNTKKNRIQRTQRKAKKNKIEDHLRNVKSSLNKKCVGDDPIDEINHMMSFLTTVVISRYPATNNQLRTSSNPHQQATINNERVTIQPIQGRKNSMTAGSSRPYALGSGGASGKQR